VIEPSTEHPFKPRDPTISHLTPLQSRNLHNIELSD
jgi:hypothetical protein